MNFTHNGLRAFAFTVIFTCFLAAGGGLLWWYFLPWIYISELSTLDGGDDIHASQLSKKIVACGSRSAPFVVSALADYSPFERGYGFLPRALFELGEEGRIALHRAADHEQRLNSLAYLNYVLMSTFHDYTIFDRVLVRLRAERVGKLIGMWYTKFFSENFNSAPEFMLDGKVNEKFVIWWEETGNRK